jgi:hypothetical protein
MSDTPLSTLVVPAAEQDVTARLISNSMDALPNEKTLMTLMTMMGSVADGTEEKKALMSFSAHQMKYFTMAMQILTVKATEMKGTEESKIQIGHLQRQFGYASFQGAMELAKLLKAKSDQEELSRRLHPFVMDTLRARHGAEGTASSGFKLEKPGTASRGEEASTNMFTFV